jgi:periplasmic protein TonB
MFSNLIESGSHTRDLRRKGTFFLGTLAFYGVMLLAAGVGSIYAYNATLEDRDDYEVLAVMDFSRAREERAEPVVKRSAASKPSGGGQKSQTAVVRELAAENPNITGRPMASENARVLPRGMDFKFGNDEFIPPAASLGGGGDGKPGGSGKGDGPLVSETPGEGPPAMAKAAPTPSPTPKPEVKKVVSLASHVITSKAISKPAPPYPITAKMAGAQGPVTVQIVVDEQGRVVSSKATGGHPLLRSAAERAAYQAHFTPTLLGGQPVKVTGVMTYNFVLQ